MTDLKDIAISGKAGNHDLNVTTREAEQMGVYFESLFTSVNDAKVIGLVINTTVNTATPSALIPIEDVEPHPPNDMKLFYALQVVSSLMGQQNWDVSSWLARVKSSGIEVATRDYMGMVTTNFSYLNYPQAYAGISAALTAFYKTC